MYWVLGKVPPFQRQGLPLSAHLAGLISTTSLAHIAKLKWCNCVSGLAQNDDVSTFWGTPTGLAYIVCLALNTCSAAEIKKERESLARQEKRSMFA